MCTVYAVVLVTILSLSLTLYSAFPRWVCLMGSALCLLVRSKTRSFKIIAWEKNKIASENVHNEIVFSAHSNTYTTYRCAHTLQVNRFQLSGKIGSSSFRIIRTFDMETKTLNLKAITLDQMPHDLNRKWSDAFYPLESYGELIKTTITKKNITESIARAHPKEKRCAHINVSNN